MNQRINWTKEETIIALYGYCHIPFGRIYASNPEIIKLAKLLNRSPGSVSMKLANLASLDPSISQAGLKNSSRLDKEVWETYSKDHVRLFSDSETIFARLKQEHDFNEKLEMFSYLQDVASEDTERTAEVKIRVNQAKFRNLILSIYDHECCITGLKSDCMLEAAHIVSWAEDEKNRLNPTNGLCLNNLFHEAYDNYLVTVTPDYIFKVHQDLIICDKRDPFILQSFTHYNNRRIYLPDDRQLKPNKEFLDIHYHKFLNR